MFTTAGLGEIQHPLNALSLVLGGHIRVGMGDNINSAPGEKAKSNAQLVELAAHLVQDLNRTVATPAQAREMLNIDQTPTQYT